MYLSPSYPFVLIHHNYCILFFFCYFLFYSYSPQTPPYKSCIRNWARPLFIYLTQSFHSSIFETKLRSLPPFLIPPYRTVQRSRKIISKNLQQKTSLVSQIYSNMASERPQSTWSWNRNQQSLSYKIHTVLNLLRPARGLPQSGDTLSSKNHEENCSSKHYIPLSELKMTSDPPSFF